MVRRRALPVAVAEGMILLVYALRGVWAVLGRLCHSKLVHWQKSNFTSLHLVLVTRQC
jgi:predicted transcriptional regulator